MRAIQSDCGRCGERSRILCAAASLLVATAHKKSALGIDSLARCCVSASVSVCYMLSRAAARICMSISRALALRAASASALRSVC